MDTGHSKPGKMRQSSDSSQARGHGPAIRVKPTRTSPFEAQDRQIHGDDIKQREAVAAEKAKACLPLPLRKEQTRLSGTNRRMV